MKINTTRFGELDIDGGKVIFMPEGILGFPRAKRYVLLETRKRGPFVWLQAVDDPDLAFIVLDPLAIDEGYDVPVYPRDMSSLKAGYKKDISFLLIVSIRKEGQPSIEVNLQGPVAINRETFIGKQLVFQLSEVPQLSIMDIPVGA